MKKLLLLFLITGCSTSEKMPTVIGYEKDNGTKHNIINGDLNSLEVVKAYFDAYNKGDLQTVVELEHKDVVFYNPNGTMIESSKKHLEVVHQFLNDNPVANWDITWSMSANVTFDDNPTENWVT